MPLTNVTIDEVSALIQYHGVGGVPWVDSPTRDPELGNYWDSTYHSSDMWRASATLLFDGIAVYVYGSKRSLHGAYGVYLDGQYVYNNNGYSLNPQFKKLMYSATGLAPGIHNLTYINIDPSNKTFVEVDYFTWTTSMDASLTESTGTAISHTSTDMIYSSSAAWSQELDSDPTMVTSTDGASVTIGFTGNGIVLNGKTGLAFGMFSVQVDSNPPRQLNASSQQTHSTILYREDNLKSGNHTLTVVNHGGGFTALSIGSATPIVWSADPNSPSSNSSGPSHHVNSGTIAGAVVGAVVSLAALALFAIWFLRRRRAKKRAAEEEERTNQRPQSGFVQPTPFVFPYSPQSPQSPTRSYESRKTEMQAQYSPMLYAPGPSSPGMVSPGLTSHGSFDFGHRSATTGIDTFSAGASSSGRGGPASEANRSTTALSKTARYPGSTGRTEFDEESMRDRDAGPVVLPQLPPAYSDSHTVSSGAPTTFASRALHTPIPGQAAAAPNAGVSDVRMDSWTEQR